MLDKLTQEQQWGIAYKCQQANEMATQNSVIAVRQNEQIAKENENLIEKKPLLPVPAAKTVEEYALGELARLGDQGYTAIVDFKMAAAKEKLKALPPEELNALLSQFAIPDAIQS